MATTLYLILFSFTVKDDLSKWKTNGYFHSYIQNPSQQIVDFILFYFPLPNDLFYNESSLDTIQGVAELSYSMNFRRYCKGHLNAILMAPFTMPLSY